MNAQTVLGEIINIQFFITQSNTDASIIGEMSGRRGLSWLGAHCTCVVNNKNKNFFSFRWNDLCDYMKILCRAVELHVYRFCSQCHGNCNKSTGCCSRCLFWLKCKCKFAHETDGLMQPTTKVFLLSDVGNSEGKSNPITYRSTFFPRLTCLSFLGVAN